MKRNQILRLVLSALLLALGLMLPFLTGQIPQVGNMLSPMHFPVFLAGFLAGWPYGLAVGLIAPPLRFLLFGMPPIFPTGVCMMAELAAYGAVSAIMHRALPKKYGYLYVSLLTAMLLGRVVWGGVRLVLMGLTGLSLTWQVFISAVLVDSIPGILVQILLLPPIVRLLDRRNY